MTNDTFCDWEHRFIEATGAFPPGKDVPAAAGDSIRRASFLELWRWIAGQQEAKVERLQAIVGKLSPRLVKLLTKGRWFVIVGEHEPYYLEVYRLIREQERKQGTWTADCEDAYDIAAERWLELARDEAAEAVEEKRCY